MLARMDTRVAADGHTRARGETLSRFALRLGRRAWTVRRYAAYVEVRYRRDIPGARPSENQLRTATTRPEPPPLNPRLRERNHAAAKARVPPRPPRHPCGGSPIYIMLARRLRIVSMIASRLGGGLS